MRVGALIALSLVRILCPSCGPAALAGAGGAERAQGRRARQARGGRGAGGRGSKMHAYVVVSLLTGARTEELRALLWGDVDLVGRLEAKPPVPPSMAVWRSVRATGDTTTRPPDGPSL